MNTESRIREYLRHKADTLDIEAKPAPLAQPPARFGRGRVVALAAVAALILIGAPLVVLSQVADDPATEEIAATTLSPTTTTAPATTTTATPVVVGDPIVTTESCGTLALRPPGNTVAFYALCSDRPDIPYPVYREGSTTPTLEQSIAQLLAGTTDAESDSGVHAPFDSIDGMDEVLVSVTIAENGTARIELSRDGVPWLADTASWSSTQLNSLLDPLHATVFAHPEVTGLDMTTLCFEQVSCDRTVSRAEWAGMLFTNSGAVIHDTCNLEQAWLEPNRCTLDGVLAATTFSGTVADIQSDDTLKVRSGPGREFFLLDELELGKNLVVTNATSPATDGGLWRIVDSGSSAPGWVNASFLDIVEE